MISSPGNKVYIKYNNLNKLLFYFFKKYNKQSIGLVLLNTEKGIITNNNALHFKRGGEVLCIIF